MKKIILALIVLVVTGCSVNYNVKINDDFTINEKVEIKEDDKFYEQYYRTTRKNALNGILDNYSNILKNNNYRYDISNDENPSITLEKTFNSIEDFINNSLLFNDYFDKINYNNDGSRLKINTEGFNPNDSDNPDRFNVSKLSITINPSYKVVNHNASSFDENENSLTYILDDDLKDFSVSLELDVTKKFNPLTKDITYIIIAVSTAIMAWIFVIIKSKKRKI